LAPFNAPDSDASRKKIAGRLATIDA